MVSECRPDEIEAYAMGELGEGDAARVAAHVGACVACAEELRWLRRERRLFAARAGVHPAPPPLSAVLARAFEADEAAEAAPARPSEPAPMRPARAARGAAPRGRRGAGAARARRGGGMGSARAVVATAGRVLVAAVVLAMPLALCLPRGGEAPLAEEPRAISAQEASSTHARAEAAPGTGTGTETETETETGTETETETETEARAGACEEACAPSEAGGGCGEGYPVSVACAQEMGGAECGAEASCCVTSDEQRP